MKFQGLKVLAILLMGAGLAACGRPSEEPHSPAPELDFECSSAMGSVCTPDKAGSNLIVGLSEELGFECDFNMMYYSGTSLYQQFEYSSVTVMDDFGTYLYGVTKRWVNFAQAPVISLPEKEMKICAFIDLNGNQRLDVGEPLHESVLNIGDNFMPFSTWTVQ